MANQEAPRGGMDEFIVDKEKVEIVHTFKEKTERLFEVKIKFDSVDKQKQWIAVHGEKIDRKNAKEYIIALCHPEAVQHFTLGSYDTEVLNEDAIEQIEKQTNAAICPLDQEKVQIRGTDLAVILAVSSLESIVGHHGNNDTETDGDKVVTNAKDEASEESITNFSRLDTTLRKALSSQSDVACSIDDYNQTSPSIKMTLIKCMSEFTDIEDSDLFPSTGSSCGPVSYKLPVYIDDEEDDDSDKREAGNILEHQDSVDGRRSCHVGNLTKQMTQTAISPFSSPQPKKSFVPDTPEHQYLRKFGLSVGYSVEEVEEGLLYVDNKTKPADFLEMLNEIKQKFSNDSNKTSAEDSNTKLDSNKIPENKKESETVINTDQENNSKGTFPPPPEIPTGEGAGIAGRRSLPQDYKKRLIKDFTEENGELSVKELKRRNEERQRMLRMAFDTNQSEKEKSENTPSEGKSSKKKKRKKKKKNKTQEKEIAKPAGKKQTDTSGHNISMHVISSDDDDDMDEEETCVLEVWKKNENKQKCDSDDECQITHVTQEVPVIVQPQANSSNHQSPRHYQPRQQLPQYSHPPPPLMDFQRYPPPSPQYRGRLLVNQPQLYVNRPPNHLQAFAQPQPYMNRPTNYLQQAPIRNAQGRQQPTQLRYIVIDGSNVAMCHGNGKVFSCKGIQIVIDYFLKRGHKQVTAFVPEWRKYNPRPENPIRDQDILEKLKSAGHLVFTPSRRLHGRLIVSYDDRFVLELAEREDGIVVSNDQYRDLMGEKFSWRKVIEERLLLFSFAGDNFMPPFDPLGRDGPTLDDFLCKPASRKRPASPLSTQVNAWQQRDGGSAIKNPGYINRGQPNNPNFQGQRYQQNFPQVNQGYKQQHTGNHEGFPNRGRGRGSNNNQISPRKQHNPVRSEEKTREMETSLMAIFPDHLEKIQEILKNHQSETDLQKLTNYLMNAIFPS